MLSRSAEIEPFADVLDRHGVPAGPTDWSFAPFSDQGAWFAMAPAPDESGGGFTGPFMMTSGQWLSPRLATLDVDVHEDGVGDGDNTDAQYPSRPARSRTLPGMLLSEQEKLGLARTETLWFDAPSTALYRVELTNVTSIRRAFTLSWTGELFSDQGALAGSGDGVVARASTGESFLLTVERETAPVEISGTRYRMGLVDRFELDPGESVTTALTMTFAWNEATMERRPVDVEASFARNRERWTRYLASLGVDGKDSEPQQILLVKALETLVTNWRAPLGRMRFSSLFPSANVDYFNGFWAWDSWKHAAALAHFDPALAKDQVRLMFDHQNPSGMVPDVIYLDAAEDNWRDTKPPLAGWAIEIIYTVTRDLDFVRELYPKLSSYHAFWYQQRDHDGDGLCEYGSTDGTLEAARWESGMDNAVRFDETKMLKNSEAAWSMDQESVDLNSYLYFEKLVLGRLAEALGLQTEAVRWHREANALADEIRDQMYDENSGWFYDIDVSSKEIVAVQGPEGFIPLWAGLATPEQAERVRETLLDEAKFRTYVPFPTVSRAHPEFSDGYWRGLVWLDQAYFAIQGLARYGYEDDAVALTRQLFDHLDGATSKGPPLFENYDPLTGAGRNVKHFSWSAAHLLLLAIEGPTQSGGGVP